MAELKDAGKNIDLGRSGLLQDEFMLNFFFLEPIYVKRTLVTVNDKCSVTVLKSEKDRTVKRT